MKHVVFGAACAMLCAYPSAVFAQSPAERPEPLTAVTTEKAKVMRIVSVEIRTLPGTTKSATYQTLEAEILTGSETGRIVTAENDYLELAPGDTFFLLHVRSPEGSDTYTVHEPNRLPTLGVLFAVFILAVITIGGWTGIRGLAALAASIFFVLFLLLPGMEAGYDPFLIAVGVSALIVIFGSYLTHGVNKTTSAAVVGMIITVAVTAAMAYLAIHAAELSGFADEETATLHFASDGQFDFVGLLLGAIMIGALGILYDAAIGQAVAVEELLRAAPHMPKRILFARALRIGREHIGALVNTLVIAYVGAALPLLLLFSSYGTDPFLTVINREVFATEIVRAIVGTLGILLTIPISTIAAIFLLTRISSPPSTVAS